ncbi:pre-mRNA processing RNA-helicase [Mortierella antarctica]|nr:pre-mRNA processing RNA-helicase [Mortierella antarctica]
MARPRSSSREGRSRSPSSSKRSRLDSPGLGFSSIQSPSFIAASRASSYGTLRSDAMDLDNYHSHSRSDRDRYSSPSGHSSSDRDRERERERYHRDRASEDSRHRRDRSRDREDRSRYRDREHRDRDRHARERSRERDYRNKDSRPRSRDGAREHDSPRDSGQLNSTERSDSGRSTPKPDEDRDKKTTSGFTPLQPVSLVSAPVSMSLGKAKAPISISLGSGFLGSGTTAPPRTVSSAFAESDVVRQRRENVLQWRLEREAAKKAEEEAKASSQLDSKPELKKFAFQEPATATTSTPTKAWNWDDDDDEDESSSKKDAVGDVVMADQTQEQSEEKKDESAMDEDEVDPLDAFMVDVTAEVKQLEKKEQKRDIKINKALSKAHSATPQSSTGAEEDDEEDPAESSEEEDILAMAAKRIKKKDIPAVDHSKMHYEFFRKDFYLEPPEMADMTPEEIHMLRLELDGIKIRGADCPKPIRKWTQAGLPAGCIQVIKDKLNYTAPTSIQCQAIPAIMSGRDVIAVAKTGSGKTIAFILPMLRHIKDQRPLENMEGPIGIIMTPTRELAVQIHKECKNFLKVLGLRAVCAYGGSPIKDQIAELKRGAEIVVCTPGRLIDLLCANSGRVTNLRRTTFLVLDEADRMFDMGFEPQVMKIVNNVRPQRQVVLFSATFPKQMEALARKLLRRPLEITVGARSVVCEDVTQIVEVREDDTRFTRLLEILGKAYNDDSEARVLIFVSRQEAADNLLRDLIRRGYISMSIHGGKDQVDRDSAIADFKSGVCQILIATSVAARGLDVKKLGIVINYECPNHMEDYVHRVGRTGRAGNKGVAYTFITPEQERFAPDIAKALTNSSTAVSPELQALVDSFNEKIKSGDAKQTASGFGGKGLEKFEKERDKVLAIQKKTYGGGEDEEGSDDDGETKELVLETKVVTAGITAAKAAAATEAESRPTTTTTTTTTTTPAPTSGGAPDQSEALRLAREAAERISRSLGGDGKQRAMEVIQNLNKARPSAGGDGAGAAGAGAGNSRDNGLALEIEINDYPVKARLMVTQKMMINQISDHSGAAITTRGVFVEEGKQPPPGERKLYLFVEGDSQMVIDKAKNEIRRILQEETMNAMDAQARGGGGGRYVV